jgi:hypothetical protein
MDKPCSIPCNEAAEPMVPFSRLKTIADEKGGFSVYQQLSDLIVEFTPPEVPKLDFVD